MKEYFKQEYEGDKRKAAENWELAIGLQKVDNLAPSQYLIEVAKENIEGKISYDQVHELLYSYYADDASAIQEQRECDLVSARISDYLSNFAFSFSPETLKGMHGYLFSDIYDHAGQYRKYNLTKKEAVLGGKSVVYGDFRSIEKLLDYDFNEEREFDYSKCDQKRMVKRIAAFTSRIWQVHPFMEGNTRTTALFMECYLQTIGFSLDNHMFAEKAQYFRNALVRSNYANYPEGIVSNNSFLEAFFENLLFAGHHRLQNRNLIIAELVRER